MLQTMNDVGAGPAGTAATNRPVYLAYATAALIGLVAVVVMLPLAAITTTGGVWDHPGRDLAQNATGHLVFQADRWGWPLLFTPDLAWPHGISIGLTDSNPLFSLIAKALVPLTGRPVNLLGAWFALCWFAQPIAAVYAIRGLCPQAARRWEVTAAAAVFPVLCPELLQRYMHINLMGQFILLLALGVTARMLAVERPRWFAATAVLCLAVLTHPYLFVFSGIVMAAPVLRSLGSRQRWRTIGGYLVAVIVPVALFQLLSGSLGGNDRGFGLYSMNLLSPVWPQRSGLFGASLPILDPSGGQYEGFNYQGAGALLLAAAAVLSGGLRGLRRWWPLAAVLLMLTALAVTQRVYAGPYLIVPAGLRPWDQIFGSVRSSGRAFWIVGYAVVLGSIGWLGTRLPRPWLPLLLGAAALLQIVDTGPLRSEAQHYYAAGELNPPALPTLPAGNLLRVLPVCMPPGPLLGVPDLLRLAGAERGMRLADMRASRLPRWFNCESNLSDGLETPLQPGEVRVLIGSVAAGLRTGALGPTGGKLCRQQGDYVVCASTGPVLGQPIAETAPVPGLQPGATADAASLPPLLGTGWHMAGDAWSEGPRSTLLFQGVAGSPAHVTLHLRGIPPAGVDARLVLVSVNDGVPRTVRLPGQADTVLDVAIPPNATGLARIVFDIFRPVDPQLRHEDLPVHRAGVVLSRLTYTLD